MRILIGGFVAFAVWTVFSAWMYKDNLYPVFNPPEPAAVAPGTPPPVEAAPAPEPAPEKLSIYFGFDDAAFKNDPQTDNRIADFKRWLEKNPSAKLGITGHTDARGSEQYNDGLGMKRASVVEKFITSVGVPADRLVVASRGESEPAADNASEEGRSKNRRTEITIKTE